MPSDRDSLLEMGFSGAKVTRALKATKNAGLQPAMDWLFAHAEESDDVVDDDPMDTDAKKNEAGGDDGEITAEEATAQSLKCDDCGRLLRDATAAEGHAIKTGHQNFSESTQIIKPLTEEEKKAKLEELKARLALKKEEKRLKEIEEEKAREKVRRKSGREITDLKERQKELEMKKALDAKIKEKEEDRIAKAKIKAQIEADKRDRAAKAEKEKLERQGLSPSASSTSLNAAPAPAASAPTKEYTESRIQLRLMTGGTLNRVFKCDAKLQEIYTFVAAETGNENFKLMTTFPRKVLDERDKTLKELGLVPSAALAVAN
ncbi:hypothetical protein HDU76_010860 [Blyttiomyces sp. JEL0837]|nr:hypothetical protein HDU76_010860 [Blyttiomyces sp. JEL0837]